MQKVELGSSKNKKALQTHDGLGGYPVIETTNYGKVHGTFRAVARSTAGVSTVVPVDNKEAISLTDLIITTDKVQSATVTVRFSGDANTVILAAADVSDAPCHLAIGFSGKWTGWQNAKIDVVTVGAVKANISCGYYKVTSDRALPFAAWDALR